MPVATTEDVYDILAESDASDGGSSSTESKQDWQATNKRQSREW